MWKKTLCGLALVAALGCGNAPEPPPKQMPDRPTGGPGGHIPDGHAQPDKTVGVRSPNWDKGEGPHNAAPKDRSANNR